MLFPIGDDNRDVSGRAVVTLGLILANLVVYFVFQGGGSNDLFTYGWSVIPYEITNGVDLTEPQVVQLDGERVVIPQAPGPWPIYLTILSAMFMHGGFMHLFGNLLYLWIFGDNVEHRFGKRAFILFYLVSGVAATFAQIALSPEGVIPNLGASGAISGVLGAYLVLFPRNKIHTLFFFWIVSLPASVVIGLWIILQLFSGWGTMTAPDVAGGVAYGAHVGGFFAGAVLALVMRGVIKDERPSVLTRREEQAQGKQEKAEAPGWPLASSLEPPAPGRRNITVRRRDRTSQPWFVLRNGRQYGPVSHAQLADLYESGDLKASDYVWTNGMMSWQPAGRVLS
jgi:membrane associated rhomboid family serine protease